MRAEKAPLEVELAQQVQPFRADQRGRLAAQDAAEHDDRDAGRVQQFLGDGQAVGDDGQIAAALEVLCNGERGAAAVEEDGVAVGDQCGGRGPDPPFLHDLLLAAQGQR